MTVGLAVALGLVLLGMTVTLLSYVRFFDNFRWECWKSRMRRTDWDAEFVRQFGHDERKEDR